MGLIQKKDEKDVVDGIEVIGRGEGPDPEAAAKVDLVEGKTAEDISGKTAAKDEGLETEPDPELADDADGDKPVPDAATADEAGEPESDDAEPISMETQGGECDAERSASAKAPAHRGKHSVAIAVVVLVVAVVAAAIIGYVIGNGGTGAKGADSANLTEDQLDTTVATWTYKGARHDVTAREAIESQYSLDAVKNSDGTYPAPSSSIVLTYVQNQIMLADADSRGISVSDDEVKQAAEKSLGSSDWSTIAEQYGTSKDQAKKIVKQQATLQKLYAKVVPDAATAPTAPTEPSDGNQNTASKDYADYIIGLAGDEWDADKGTWKSTDGTIATALSGEQFTADSATYAQALKAYSAAYQDYQTKSSKASSTWTDYVNGLFADADLELYGIFA